MHSRLISVLSPESTTRSTIRSTCGSTGDLDLQAHLQVVLQLDLHLDLQIKSTGHGTKVQGHSHCLTFIQTPVTELKHYKLHLIRNTEIRNTGLR